MVHRSLLCSSPPSSTSSTITTVPPFLRLVGLSYLLIENFPRWDSMQICSFIPVSGNRNAKIALNSSMWAAFFTTYLDRLPLAMVSVAGIAGFASETTMFCIYWRGRRVVGYCDEQWGFWAMQWSAWNYPRQAALSRKTGTVSVRMFCDGVFRWIRWAGIDNLGRARRKFNTGHCRWFIVCLSWVWYRIRSSGKFCSLDQST